MPTPKELRALTEQGKANRKNEAERLRKEEERKAREERMEKALKEQAEAQHQIANLERSMKLAAENGRDTVRVCQVYTQDPLALDGVPRILYFYFQKQEFRVQIIQEDGPDIREGPDYNYFITISW